MSRQILPLLAILYKVNSSGNESQLTFLHRLDILWAVIPAGLRRESISS
jgi:hypothetical protein